MLTHDGYYKQLDGLYFFHLISEIADDDVTDVEN